MLNLRFFVSVDKLLVSTCFACLVFFESRSQIRFVPGYVILSDGARVECLVKDEGWAYNPAIFEFKRNEQAAIEQGTLSSVTEFGVGGKTKYVIRKVDIDQSSDNLDNMNNDPAPKWKSSTVFLKVLVEGEANLYLFKDVSVTRFFFSLNNGEVKQLVNKRYYAKSREVGTNDLFKSQLSAALICGESPKTSSLSYDEGSLITFFRRYNNCVNGTATAYEPEGKGRVRVKAIVGVAISELTASYPTVFGKTEGLFGPKPTFTGGLDVELVLPTNRNKWSVFLSPAYRSFSDEYTVGKDKFAATYNSIEVPVGLRYYMFLNDKSRLFVNAAYVADVPMNSSITLDQQVFVIKSRANYLIGGGYQVNRFSAEFRFYTLRDVLKDYFITNDFKNFSLLVGYNLIK